MRQWHDEGLGVKTIAKRLRRSTDTASSKHVFQGPQRGRETPRGTREACRGQGPHWGPLQGASLSDAIHPSMRWPA